VLSVLLYVQLRVHGKKCFSDIVTKSASICIPFRKVEYLNINKLRQITNVLFVCVTILYTLKYTLNPPSVNYLIKDKAIA